MATALNSLTLNGKKYDCFADPEARDMASDGIKAITCSGDGGIDIETPCGAHHKSGPITAGGLTEAAQEEILGRFGATVPAWAKQPNKPSYTADEVGAISQEQLGDAVDQALAEAKASGEFDGAPGATGPQGPKGDPYTLTEADKAEIAVAVIESLGGNPVFGYVDEDNNIIVQGDLADGMYSVKYEMENGEVVDIGNMVLDSNVYYSVTSTLTNCTSNNSTKTVVEGGSYAATITAKDGYELKSVTVTMSGSPVSVSGDSISIASVTGDIVITAVAEEAAKDPTNFIVYNATNKTDWGLYCNGARIGSDGAYRSSTTQDVTNYIAVQNGDEVHWRNMVINGQNVCLYKTDKAAIMSSNVASLQSTGYIADATTLDAETYDGQFTITNASAAYIRFTILRGGYTNLAPTGFIVNIKRNGEWL